MTAKLNSKAGRRVLFAMVLCASAGMVLAQVDEENVKKSWDEGTFYVPGKMFSTSPQKIAVDKPLPVVIYLHGCSGITPDQDLRWGQFIRDQGFIAVLPDSMARPGRRANCNPKLKTGGTFPQAYAMRQEEIAYALAQVKKAPWADARNVFLMGHSEGGQSVARTPIGDFRGVIISGWTCTHATNADFDGIRVPIQVPILAMAFDHDAWREGKPTQGSCANKFGERKSARQVTLSGTDHGTYDQREAREAVAQFLKQNILP